MKNTIHPLILFLSFVVTSCQPEVEKKVAPETKVETEINTTTRPNPQLNPKNKIKEIWKTLQLKSMPIVDSTNFDNIKEAKAFNPEQIKSLQLTTIYPNFNKENYNFKAMPSYRLKIAEHFYTIVITTYKGDHELESTLINYDLNGKLIAHQIIAYDEIAEGWSRIFSKIENNNITITDAFYGDEVQIETTLFHINENGAINQSSDH